MLPSQPDIHYAEQSINNILVLKSFVQSVAPIYEALSSAQSELLNAIRDHCQPAKVEPAIRLIEEVINGDVTHQVRPLDLRNQRTYAVKVSYSPCDFVYPLTHQSGVSGLLDVARQTFKEATEDVHQHVTEINRMSSLLTSY